ncbi:hypothetical protein PAHAL_5G252300 [Panicum hallii]|uniref:Uncharacterized protein n=1 Tax=Panicum hallii TaxID=206008 RepID=A0A2T8IL55_9POAL|nr:hypothetical protein PAHAL_5G252300 [Panicum hallii]
MYNALKSEPVLAVYCFFIGCLRRVCTCVLEASGTRYCGRRRECKRPKSSNCLYNCTSVHGRRDGGSSFWLPQLLVCPHHCIRPALRSRALAAKPAFFDFDRATVPVHRSFHHHWAQYALGAMAVGVPWPLCLLACLLLGAGGVAGNARAPPRVARALSRPLIVNDGRVVACSGNDLLAFEGNGSIAWVAPLGLRCNDTISPVSDGKKVYLVAEDRVIKVTPPNVRTAKPASEVFFSYNATPGRSEEIVGLSVTGSYSSLFLTIRNLGLFEFSLEGELQWSLGPVLDWFGYRLGCKGNISGCYFDSAPVLDHRAGALYIFNTEGQIYSFNFQSRALRWIQDLTSLDKVMTLAPGSSRCLYIVFPRKSIVVGLDVSTGNISWQQSIGPLINEKSFPTVDNNGWMSIGSLDGILYSISPDGDLRKLFEETALDSAIPVDPVLDCSGFSMYVAKTVVEGKSIWTTGEYTSVSVMKPSRSLVTLLDPANGTIYWTGEYPGNLSNLMSIGDLNDFAVDETLLLTLLSASRFSNATQCDARRETFAWYCRQNKTKSAQADPGENNPVLLVLLVFLLIIIVIQAEAFCFCCIFWRKKKLRDKGLQKFLEKRCSALFRVRREA